MNRRWMDIVEYLGSHNVATSEAMAEALCVSAKTIRTDLKGLHAELKDNGAYIQSKQRVGYSMIIVDQEAFQHFMTESHQDAVHQHGKPTMILAHTIKGKGVSFMENNYAWHEAAPNKEQYETAIKELGGDIHD